MSKLQVYKNLVLLIGIFSFFLVWSYLETDYSKLWEFALDEFIFIKPNNGWITVHICVLAVLVLSGTFSEKFTSIIMRLWMKLGGILGKIIPPIILFFVYYIVLTPVALLSRRFGVVKMVQKRQDNAVSYFFERNHQFSSEELAKLW